VVDDNAQQDEGKHNGHQDDHDIGNSIGSGQVGEEYLRKNNDQAYQQYKDED